MSIEYFVEGKILTQTEGNNTTFLKKELYITVRSMSIRKVQIQE